MRGAGGSCVLVYVRFRGGRVLFFMGLRYYREDGVFIWCALLVC